MSFNLLSAKEEATQNFQDRSCELAISSTTRVSEEEANAGARLSDGSHPTFMEPVGSQTALLISGNKDSAASFYKESDTRRPLMSSILPREIFGSAGEHPIWIALSVCAIGSACEPHTMFTDVHMKIAHVTLHA